MTNAKKGNTSVITVYKKRNKEGRISSSYTKDFISTHCSHLEIVHPEGNSGWKKIG